MPTISPEKKQSSFLDQKAELILKILVTEAQKKTFAKAMKLSTSLDISGLEANPPSVHTINEEFGFQPDVQRNYFIAVNRKQAKIFLQEMGVPVRSDFDKVYNRPYYFEVFKKEPFTIGKRQMILTYSEWLHFVKYPFEPEFPSILTTLLRA